MSFLCGFWPDPCLCSLVGAFGGTPNLNVFDCFGVGDDPFDEMGIWGCHELETTSGGMLF